MILKEACILSTLQKLTSEELAELLQTDVKKDLHLHTYYSDGVLSPEEVTDRWASEGYKLIAVTDHDGIEGSLVALEYAADKDITVVPGIEFDSVDPLGRDLHILGYGFDPECPELKDALDNIIMERAARNDAMLAELNKMGYGITLDDIMKVNDGRFIGKPTFATVMVRKGYLSSNQEAFNTVFREPSMRRIRKKTLSSEEVVDLIHKAGGLAVMAHPMEQRHLDETYNQFRERLVVILERMREYGIDGIECWHPSADDVQAEALRAYAQKHGLIVTRGSDFHSDYLNRDFSRYHRP